MRPAHRLADHGIDDAEPHQIIGRQLESFRRLLGMLGAAPKDGRTAFRRDYRVDRVFEHHDAVGRRQSDRTARSAFTDDEREQRDAE